MSKIYSRSIRSYPTYDAPHVLAKTLREMQENENIVIKNVFQVKFSEKIHSCSKDGFVIVYKALDDKEWNY